MKSFTEKDLQPGRILAAAMACLALLPAAAGAAEWKLSSSVNYTTGKYGTADRTDSVYIPFTLKRYYSNSDLSVTAPYLRQNSTGLVTWVGGHPVQVAKGKKPAGTSTAASAQSGLGDIMVRGGYTLMTEGPKAFGLALAGKLKLPTADKTKGLGTGKPDLGAGLEFTKEINPHWTLLADGYYTIMGEPAGADFNNQVSLDIGFYTPLSENLFLTVLYETQNAIVSGNHSPRSISGALSYSAVDGVQFSGGLALGMSDGSPGIGVNAGYSWKF